MLAEEEDEAHDAAITRKYGENSFFAGLSSLFCHDVSSDEVEPREPVGGEKEACVQNTHRDGAEKNTVEEGMFYIAFPEKYIDCGHNEKVTAKQRPTVERNQESTFQTVMDVIAFPEYHINCGSSLDKTKCSVPKVAPSALQYKAGSSFDNFMEAVAFPEEHLSCGAVYGSVEAHAPREISQQKQITPFVAVQSKKVKQKSRSHWGFEKKSKDEKNVENTDVVGNIFEDAHCCTTQQPPSALWNEGGFLHIACAHVEGTVCRGDSYCMEDQHVNASAQTYIKHNNGLIDSTFDLMAGDMLSVRGQPSQFGPRDVSPTTTSKIHDILNNKDEEGTLDFVFNNVESFACRTDNEDESSKKQLDTIEHSNGMVPDLKKIPIETDDAPNCDRAALGYGVRRDMSLISESPMSSLPVMPRDQRTKGELAQITNKGRKRQTSRHNLRRDEEMELVLGPAKQAFTERVKASGKKKNVVSRFLRGDRGSVHMSKQSRIALADGEP